MACHTQEEIAAVCNVDTKTVRNILGEMAELPKLPKSDLADAEHSTNVRSSDIGTMVPICQFMDAAHGQHLPPSAFTVDTSAF